MITRRKFFTDAAALAGGAVIAQGAMRAFAADVTPASPQPAGAGGDYTPVTTPNGATLPWKMVDGVKVFHLTAEEFDHEFAPGLKAKCWGYNGMTPGPTIEALEGDRVRFYVTNRLAEPTTMHWHGLILPNGMDGVSGVTQPPIRPGETFKYEFTLKQNGSYMYHPHFDEMTQMGLGMMGMFIIHPRDRQVEAVDRDFAIMLSEWRIDPGASRPDPMEMTEFNILTMNGKAFPGTEPLVVKQGERVRIRFGNLGAMDHHPIHLHGHKFMLTGTGGGAIPASAQWPDVTVLVPVGSTRTIEFIADNPGDWPMHCHMTHHVMNQMGHGNPNLLGIKTGGLGGKISKLIPGTMIMGESGMGDMAEMNMGAPRNSIPMVGAPGPFGYIDMGGMFTILKVRETLTNYDDPGWYDPKGRPVAAPASEEDLQRDGIG